MTVYEVNDGRGFSLQITKDLIFGWSVRSNEDGYRFEPISWLNQDQIRFLRAVHWPAYIPSEFIESIRSL